MDIKKKYGLTFYNRGAGFFCSTNSREYEPVAIFLTALDASSAYGFAVEIQQALKGHTYQPVLNADSHEGIHMEILPPDLVINGYKFPLTDAKELLEACIVFLVEVR